MVDHVVQEHGVERSQARRQMASVRLDAAGQLTYSAVLWRSSGPGDVLINHRLPPPPPPAAEGGVGRLHPPVADGPLVRVGGGKGEFFVHSVSGQCWWCADLYGGGGGGLSES